MKHKLPLFSTRKVYVAACTHPIMRNMDVKWILIEDGSLVDRFYVPQSPADNLGQFHKKHIIMEIQTSWDLFQSIYYRNWWFIGKMITFDESYDTEYCHCMILYAHTISRKYNKVDNVAFKKFPAPKSVTTSGIWCNNFWLGFIKQRLLDKIPLEVYNFLCWALEECDANIDNVVSFLEKTLLGQR